MAAILYIDNDPTLGKYTNGALGPNGAQHTVDWVRKDYWQDAVAEVLSLTSRKWDILILDIHYQTDDWGGIWIYNELVRKGVWNQPEHVIVFSQYLGSNLKTASGDRMLVMKAFLDTAGIALDCALPNQDFDRASLLSTIDDVLKR